jgi:hypothetical protein
MIEGIRGTGVIEFHNVQLAFTCSGGIGLRLCLLETRVFAHWFANEQGGRGWSGELAAELIWSAAVTLYEIRRLASRCPSRESLLLVHFSIALIEEIIAL